MLYSHDPYHLHAYSIYAMYPLAILSSKKAVSYTKIEIIKDVYKKKDAIREKIHNWKKALQKNNMKRQKYAWPKEGMPHPHKVCKSEKKCVQVKILALV